MTLDPHTKGFIEALQRIDKRKEEMNGESRLLTEAEIEEIKNGKTENFHKHNQTVYTLQELQTCYDTSDLVNVFMDVLEEGYEGLSLGLIIDLIKERVEEV
jgi:hypothetical protein